MSQRTHAERVERWRSARIARLTGPDGWLTVVGLSWLREGGNPVGGHPSNQVTLPAGRAPERVGSIVLEDGKATFLPEPGEGAPVLHAGEPVTGPLALIDDLAGRPTVLELGSLRFHVIRRYGGRLGVRVRDLESQARAAFHGIEHYPVSEVWRFDGRFEPYDPPRVDRVPTVLDELEVYRTPGAVAFDLDGTTHRLDAFLEEGETDLFIIFADQTTGKETYGGGRYLYAEPPDGQGRIELDFNRAYNPPCVFTPHATCALPLPQNRLAIRIEAGEKRYDP
jgi:uncharacterized protein (DUF1684 family)